MFDLKRNNEIGFNSGKYVVQAIGKCSQLTTLNLNLE